MLSHVSTFGKVALISLSKMLLLQVIQGVPYAGLQAIPELPNPVILNLFQIPLVHQDRQAGDHQISLG